VASLRQTLLLIIIIMIPAYKRSCEKGVKNVCEKGKNV